MPKVGCTILLFALSGWLWPSDQRAAAASTPTSQPAKRYAVDSNGKTPTPKMIVPNACAWPFTVTLADGTILAAVFNQPSHGRMIGDVDMWTSTDGGLTWAKRSTPAAHDPGTQTNRMNIAVGLDTNGDVLVICSGWTLKPHPETAGALEIDRILRACVCRSTDGGKTWSVDKESFPEIGPLGGVLIPFGTVVPADDGSLRVCAYETPVPQGEKKWRQSYCISSTDKGKTWTVGAPVDTTRALNETTLFHDAGSRWLAVGRHARLEIYESTDDARTWRHLSTATENNAVPGQLMRLKDGRLLLSHGNRFKGDERVEARISTDGGKTFSEPVRLVDFITFDGGYPNSEQRADGMIVTAYYAKQTTYHDGYHMGVVIWDPAKTFPVSK